MKALINFIKVALIGGLLVVLPVWVTVLILIKIINAALLSLQPIARLLPQEVIYDNAVAFILLVMICFISGLLIQANFSKRMVQWIERQTFERIPGYILIRGIIRQLLGGNEELPFQPVLAELEDALVPAFVVEKHEDGKFTIFVSSSPTPMAGSIIILPPDRVHFVDISLAKAMNCITRWGEGTSEMVKAMRIK